MKNIYLLLLFIINLCSCYNYIDKKNQIVASNGVLDLRKWDFNEDGPVILKGEWEFFWEKFVTFKDLDGNGYINNDGFIFLPGTWENQVLGTRNFPREGYGTFRLKVLTKNNNEKMAFRFYEQTNPLSLFVNESLITSIGKVAEQADDVEYNSYPHIMDFSFMGNEMDIIVHVSNFHYRKLAGQKPIVLGTYEQLLTQRIKELIFEYVVAGCIFIISLYHVIIYITIKEKFEFNLFFALLSFSWILRYLLIGNCAINAVFFIVSWEIRRKLIGLSIYLFFLFFTIYVKSLYPNDGKRVINRMILIAGGISTLTYVFLPGFIFKHYAYFFIFILHILLIFFIGYNIYILFTICKLRRENSIFFTISSGILGLGFLIEIVSFYFFPSLYYPPFSIIFIFIFFQTYINIKHMRSHLNKTKHFLKELNERDIEIFRLKEEQIQLCVRNTEFLLTNQRITNREKDIIINIIENRTNSEIANELCISYFTVRRHINNIYKKLDIENRVELLKFLIYNN